MPRPQSTYALPRPRQHHARQPLAPADAGRARGARRQSPRQRQSVLVSVHACARSLYDVAVLGAARQAPGAAGIRVRPKIRFRDPTNRRHTLHVFRDGTCWFVVQVDMYTYTFWFVVSPPWAGVTWRSQGRRGV